MNTEVILQNILNIKIVKYINYQHKAIEKLT